MKSKEEKTKRFHQEAAALRKKVVEAGATGLIVSCVLDGKGGLLILGTPGIDDILLATPLAWESNDFTVLVFSVPPTYHSRTDVSF
jgi:hypothetical protein